MFNGMELRYFIYNIMVKSGRNEVEFAKAIGVTQSCVNHWLRGKSVPNRKNMVKIAAMNK
jgi:predicted transcriptional regulator